jgi:hypothetical protein
MALAMTPLLAGATAITSSSSPALGVLSRYDATGGAITASLPALSSVAVGARLAVTKIDSTANVVTLSCAGSDTTTEGAANITLKLPSDRMELQAVKLGSSTAWAVVDSSHDRASLDTRYYRSSDPLTGSIQTVPRWMVLVGLTRYPTSNGIMYAMYVTADQTVTVSKLYAKTADYALGSPTLCRMGIYSVDSGGNLSGLIASTPNDTTLFTSSYTGYAKALSSPVTLTLGTRYAFALLVTFTGGGATWYGNQPNIGDITGPEGSFTAAELSSGILNPAFINGTTIATVTDLPSSVTVSGLNSNNAPTLYMRAM